MENLIFSLNATMPVFLMMVLGFFLRRAPFVTEDFANRLNTFAFKVILPVQQFQNIATSEFQEIWDGKFVLFSALSTLATIFIMLLLSRFVPRRVQAEFVQGGYRSSQALLGAALMQNIYGSNGPLALILLGSVPIYNVAAVMLLTLLPPDGKGELNAATMKKTLKGVVTNPIILGITAGLLWSLLGLPQPTILNRGLNSLAVTATPIGLIALGMSVDLKKAKAMWKLASVCSFLKLIGFAALFLPVAVWMGWRGELLAVAWVMLASPATVSGFNMARSMGHDGTLSSCVVMMTTVCSAFTFTGWLFLLRSLGLI